MKTKQQLIEEVIQICNVEKSKAIQSNKFEVINKSMQEQKELIRQLANGLFIPIHFEGESKNVQGGIITTDGIFIDDI